MQHEFLDAVEHAEDLLVMRRPREALAAAVAALRALAPDGSAGPHASAKSGHGEAAWVGGLAKLPQEALEPSGPLVNVALQALCDTGTPGLSGTLLDACYGDVAAVPFGTLWAALQVFCRAGQREEACERLLGWADGQERRGRQPSGGAPGGQLEHERRVLRLANLILAADAMGSGSLEEGLVRSLRSRLTAPESADALQSIERRRATVRGGAGRGIAVPWEEAAAAAAAAEAAEAAEAEAGANEAEAEAVKEQAAAVAAVEGGKAEAAARVPATRLSAKPPHRSSERLLAASPAPQVDASLHAALRQALLAVQGLAQACNLGGWLDHAPLHRRRMRWAAALLAVLGLAAATRARVRSRILKAVRAVVAAAGAVFSLMLLRAPQ